MMPIMKKRVYSFEEGRAEQRKLLGGKGANLAEMTRIGLPVPPGITVTTETCLDYYNEGKKLPAGLADEIRAGIEKLEEKLGKKFGDPENPLLLSVRSGAAISMPGMMDTILNLGLNDKSRDGLAQLTQDRRFANDCYRRFIQMFGDVVMGVPFGDFEKALEELKEKVGVQEDTDLTADDLDVLIGQFKELYTRGTGEEFPQDPFEQLLLAVEAGFASWNTDRAIVYRRVHRIPDDLGTAVNIQTMVFGNMGDDCGTGVAFTRNPARPGNIW